MAAGEKPRKMTIHLPNEDTMAWLKTILVYEAELRGMSLGQVCSELVMQSVDIDSYPEEMKARLAEIQQNVTRQAVRDTVGDQP